MDNHWAYEFYKMQYQSLNFSDEADIQDKAELLLEQFGKPVEKVLELGAGDGALARALAHKVHNITTVELVEEMVEAAVIKNPANVNTIRGSFYHVDIADTFDLVLYIDGFGVGSDEDQIKLLQNIYRWLDDGGCALIDVYHPEHWRKADGVEMYPDPKGSPNVLRRYSFDHDNNIMMDTWCHKDDESSKQTQYLKCYTLDDIHHLCSSAGLRITGYFPNGSMDYENMQYHEHPPLTESMSYRIKLKK